jgi:hypothetical protein
MPEPMMTTSYSSEASDAEVERCSDGDDCRRGSDMSRFVDVRGEVKDDA